MLLLLALLYLIQREQSHGYKVIPSRTYTSGTFLTLMPYAQQQQHQQQQRRQRAWNTAACAAPKSWDQEACRLTAGIPTAPGLLVRLVRYTHVWSAANRSSRVYVCVCVCVVCVCVLCVCLCVCVCARARRQRKRRERIPERPRLRACSHARMHCWHARRRVRAGIFIFKHTHTLAHMQTLARSYSLSGVETAICFPKTNSCRKRKRRKKG